MRLSSPRLTTALQCTLPLAAAGAAFLTLPLIPVLAACAGAATSALIHRKN